MHGEELVRHADVSTIVFNHLFSRCSIQDRWVDFRREHIDKEKDSIVKSVYTHTQITYTDTSQRGTFTLWSKHDFQKFDH